MGKFSLGDEEWGWGEQTKSCWNKIEQNRNEHNPIAKTQLT